MRKLVKRDEVTINLAALVALVGEVSRAAKRGGPVAELARVKVRHALGERMAGLAHLAQAAEGAVTGPDPEAAAAYLAMAAEHLAVTADALARIEVRP